jgi:hypothetical protein
LRASKSHQIEKEREREREKEKMKGGGIEQSEIMCNLRFGVKVWAGRENNSDIGLFRNFNFMASLKLIRATRRWW